MRNSVTHFTLKSYLPTYLITKPWHSAYFSPISPFFLHYSQVRDQFPTACRAQQELSRSDTQTALSLRTWIPNFHSFFCNVTGHMIDDYFPSFSVGHNHFSTWYVSQLNNQYTQASGPQESSCKHDNYIQNAVINNTHHYKLHFSSDQSDDSEHSPVQSSHFRLQNWKIENSSIILC